MKDDGTVYTYLGTFDDVVMRFPWKFKIDSKYLHYTLALHWITGRRLLLNDGYLLNNPLLRDALKNSNHLLRLMIDDGAVALTARGYSFTGKNTAPVRRFGLHETPEHMRHIPTFDALLSHGSDGDAWPVMRKRLELLDKTLDDAGLYFPWSPYDTGSGYLAFTNKMINEKSTARSVGLGRLVSTHNFQKFLKIFQDRLTEQVSVGPRTLWENLAKEFADDPDATNMPEATLNAFMRLGNEIYHYNFGSGLSAAYDLPIAVETQPSVAFDDLLITRDMRLEQLSDFPLPFIPKGIIAIEPTRLIKTFKDDSKLGDARREYIRLQAEARAYSDIPPHLSQSIKHASDDLSQNVARAFGRDIQISKAENAFKFIYTVSTGTGFGVLASYYLEGAGPIYAGVISGALAYSVGERMQPVAFKSYRLILDKTPQQVALGINEISNQSERILNSIKRQKTPISLELNPAVIYPLVDKMRLHK